MKKVLLPLMAIFLCSSIWAQEAKDTANHMNLGDKIPKFTVVDMNGKEVKSTSLKGKVVLLNFFATWCPPCRQELPFVKTEIWRKYKDDKDFVLMIISRKEETAVIEKFIKEQNYPMPFFQDPQRKTYDIFASTYIPRNYLFDKSGKLVLQSMGFKEAEFNELKAKLAELLED